MSRQDRFSWFSGQQRPRRSKSSPRALGRGFSLSRRLHIEPLEDRRMLAVITVTSSADDLLPDGMVTLREAIEAANTNASVDGSTAGALGADTINFSAALSGQTISLGGTDLQITEALTIDATPLVAYVTIDGSLLSRIFNITATAGDFTFAGLTLIGGATIGSNSGGAIRSLTTGDLTIDQSTVSGNSTMGDYAHGGGIFSSGDVTLTSSTVSGNSTGGLGADGGGIFSAGNVTLTNSTISGNFTQSDLADGGGIYSSLNVTLNSSIVSGNNTAGNSADGGGIYATDGTVTLTNSTVSGNSTTGNYALAGGIFSFGGVSLTSSTVSGNSTMGNNASAGGIYSAGGIGLTNSTVSGNSTAGNYANGGGIFSQGDLTLTSSTVSDNHAHFLTSVGGGIWDNATLLLISNSIVAGNTAGGGSPDIEPGGGALLVDYSLIGDTTGSGINAGTGTGNILDQPAGLLQLANNGGLTETHALLVTSLAINAGDPNFAAPPAFDQRDAPFDRVVGGRIDMGAYERQLPAPGLSSTVDTTVDEDDGDYTIGDLSLREAIGLANLSLTASTITFDPIVFATSQTISLVLGEMKITEALTIDGPGQQLLTIDAQQNSRIFNITATTGDFTIAGLTLTGGQTTGNNANFFSDTTFSGGAIRSLSTDFLTIDQSTISGNSTTGDFAAGGGIFAFGFLDLRSSTVSGNSTAGPGAVGGGISSGGITSSYLSDVTLVNSTVSGNNATADGGGIFSFYTATLINSIVSGNSSSDSSARGGGIFSGDVTLISSTVSGNSTVNVGGGTYSGGKTLLIQSTVSGNSTLSNGGGIYSVGEVTLTNSTVSGNSATGLTAFGVGIRSGGAVTLTSSTVTANHANSAFISAGGGIWNDNDTIVITNSIVAGNTLGGSGIPDIDPGTGTFDVDYSLIGDTTGMTAGQIADINAGTGNKLNQNAMLGALTNNGGPTQTHALLAGSPAIDTGDPSFTSPPNRDQRGFAFERVIGGRIDMGAFELGATSPDFDADGDVDGADFLAWQRGFGIQAPNASPSDGDANGDQAVDAADLVAWQNQYGQTAPLVAAIAPLAAEPIVTANLVDAALAIEFVRSVDAEETLLLLDESTFTETYADRVFAAEAIAPTGVVAVENEQSNSNSSVDDEAEDPWLADELLDQVFG